MSTLSENLAAQKIKRDASSQRRKKVMGAILKIAAEQTPPEVPQSAMILPDGQPAGETGHHAGDGHAHPPSKGGFDPNFDKSLKQLLKDFGGKVSVSSGYRSPERQAVLWQRALAKYGSPEIADNWVAPPGRSNHGRGLAADLKYADAQTRAAVHKRARQYGLHFPLANENWHIEPLGARKKR